MENICIKTLQKMPVLRNIRRYTYLKHICIGAFIMLMVSTVNVMGQRKLGVPNQDGFFPFAVFYSGGDSRATMLSEITPASKEQWRHDLQQIKKLGFNTVKTWIEWAHCEPKEGEYHFENLELLSELAKEEGLKVFIQVYAESAPDWVGEKYPEAEFEAQNGEKVHSQVNPGYCVDDKNVRDAMTRFLKKAASVATQYSNFYGWDLWSEPHIIQWANPGSGTGATFCYCKNTQQRFREWLQKKYVTLANINKAWYRNFQSWEQVQPPRFSTILSYTDFIDWKSFNYQKIAGDLEMRYDAVRLVDKTHVTSSHASPVSLFSTPYSGTEDDFLMSEKVNFYGLSQYPKHNLPGDWTPWRFNAGADFSYSANIRNGGYYVGEFQAGYGTVGLNVGDPVTPADHRIWAWTSLATGAKGIFAYAYYPMSSGYESGGYGLINLDGSTTVRAVELGKIAKFIDDHKSLFANSKPVKAQIAIVYNPLAQMVGGSQRVKTQDGHSNSLIGYYRFFSEHNIPVDFIHRKDLESRDLSQYKMVIVPYALMFTQKAADGLKAYVANGGHAFSEARIAWNDDRGYAAHIIPGMGLSEVFGVKESKVNTVKEVAIKIPDNTQPVTSNLKKNDLVRGAFFAESLEVLSKNSQTKVLGYFPDDSPGIVSSNYGKGQAMYVGSFLGIADSRGTLWDQSTSLSVAVKDSLNVNNNNFLMGLLDWAKISLPFKTTFKDKPNANIVIRLHENEDGFLLYVLNQGTSLEKPINIHLEVKDNGKYLLEEITKSKKVSQNAQQHSVEINTDDIEGKNVEIWSIKAVKK